jgi:hypothetical protein
MRNPPGFEGRLYGTNAHQKCAVDVDGHPCGEPALTYPIKSSVKDGKISKGIVMHLCSSHKHIVAQITIEEWEMIDPEAAWKAA